MRRLLLALGGLGGVLLLRRRRASNRLSRSSDPAGELRRKLAEARAAGDDREEFEAGETTVDQAEPSVDDRRRDVHDEARRAIDDLAP